MSKELEAFYKLGDNTPITDTWKMVEKSLKALEIIKEKRVAINCLIDSDDLEDYNSVIVYEYHLTQEEYDLLKEVLK